MASLKGMNVGTSLAFVVHLQITLSPHLFDKLQEQIRYICSRIEQYTMKENNVTGKVGLEHTSALPVARDPTLGGAYPCPFFYLSLVAHHALGS
jgi:hypothetical protein